LGVVSGTETTYEIESTSDAFFFAYE